MVVGFNLIGWWQKTLWKPMESPISIRAAGVAGARGASSDRTRSATFRLGSPGMVTTGVRF